MASNTETRSVEVIIKGTQASATIKEMGAAASVLRNQLSKLPADSKAFADKAKELQAVNGRLQAINNDIKNVKASWIDTAKGFVAGTLITKGLSAGIGVFNDAISVHREFEKSLKNLSAITGATGSDLEFYKEKAREMGMTVSGGATAVVEAFKLIGSAKPELLQNKESLALVTDQAILLSKAAGLELPDAATRLTDALNQFGAPASDAAKYVDVLAASAKYGAAEVPEVTDALLKFGVSAKSANINIYESSAAIELLAEKGLKGAEAGTQLRNVFSKMSASKALPKEALDQLSAAGVNIQKLSDKTLPLNDRLKELSKIQGNAAAITKVFGLENKVAGEVLISNLDRLGQLTDQVKEHGVAMEQAKTNTDTFEQATTEVKNAYDDLLLEITDGNFGEIIKGFVKVAGDALSGLKDGLHAIGSLFKNGFEGGALALQQEQFNKQVEASIKSVQNLSNEEKIRVAQATLAQAKHQKALIDANENLTQEARNQYMQYVNMRSTIALKLMQSVKEDKQAQLDSAAEVKDGRVKAEEDANKAIQKEREKLQDDLLKLEEEYHLKGLTDQDKQLYQAQKRRKELLDRAKGDKEAEKRIEAIFQKELNEIFGTMKMNQVKTNEEGNKQLHNADIKHVEETKSTMKLDFEDRIELARQYYAEYESLGNAFIDRATKALELQSQKNNKIKDEELQKSDEIFNEQDAKNKDLLNRKIIDEAEYNKRHDLLVAQKDQRDLNAKKKAAEKNKKIQVAQAAIHGIASVVKTLAEYPYPYNLILAALDAAFVGIEIANMKSAPAYAKGGFHRSNNPQGMVDKPTLFSNSSSGRDFIAGEAGAEWIAPNWMLKNPQTASIIDQLENIRQTKTYAAGGSNSVSQASQKQDSGTLIALASAVDRLTMLLNAGIEARFDYDNYTRSLQKIGGAQSAANVS